MSVLMMNDKGLATLSVAISQILNMGFNFFGFEAPEKLKNVLKDCRTDRHFYSDRKIFERLYTLNSRAYSDRYSVAAEEQIVPEPDFTGTTIAEPREYTNYHAIIKPWHYKLLKLLDCFNYQVDDMKDDLVPALNSLAVTLAGFIARNNDEYENAPWGDI